MQRTTSLRMAHAPPESGLFLSLLLLMQMFPQVLNAHDADQISREVLAEVEVLVS